MMDDILKEPVPPEMSEQACEAIAEELKMAQVNVLNKKWSVCATLLKSRLCHEVPPLHQVHFDLHGKLKTLINT